MPGPGALVVALSCATGEEWDALRGYCEAGTLSLDRQPFERRIDAASDREALFIRFKLLRPFIPPPPALTFEDVDVAVRIGEIGWYVFEGGLYRAEHRGGGRVVLDRVYAADPPETYHGRALVPEAALEALALEPYA